MTNKLFLNDKYPSLDFTLTIPSFYKESPLSLHDKIRQPPSVFLDKLHPKKTDLEPFVEYVDQGLWKNRIAFKKDNSYSAILSQLKAKQMDFEKKTYENLDTLCEAELLRRFPNYQLIKGFKATLKNLFPTLTKLALGPNRFYQILTQKEVNKHKKQIAYSAMNRDDLISRPTILDPTLRKQLNLASDDILQTEHLFAKNSPLNGQSFMLDGEKVHLSQAIACSNDRKVENTGNLRVIQTKEKESLCYTGRVDSDRKALEQASFIFLNELKTKRKGITQTKDENANVIYKLDYVVNSMLSIPWIWSTESAIAPFPEREYLENERKALLVLKEKGTITIEDPNCPGMKYQVAFNPILFSRSCNIFTKLENWLPPFFTGQSRAEEISEVGFSNLKTLASQKLLSLQADLDIKKQAPLEQKIKAIKACLKTLEQNDLPPEIEWATRDYLCQLLNLPSVYHCKSSTDRTSIAIALSSALHQWTALNLPIPENLNDLIKEDHFKELFAANWMTGHQITRYARGAKGTVAKEKLNPKNLGLSLSRGIAQNPIISQLLPERYLKDFPLAKKLKYTAIYLCALIPLIILVYIPLLFIAAMRSLFGKNLQMRTTKFSLPLLPFTLLFLFHRIFPTKVLNEDSFQVGKRQLISGKNHDDPEDFD